MRLTPLMSEPYDCRGEPSKEDFPRDFLLHPPRMTVIPRGRRSGFPPGPVPGAPPLPFPAFSLIELMVVVAVIAILAAMIFPSLSASKDRAKRQVCANNQKQFLIADISYSDDNEGRLLSGLDNRGLSGNPGSAGKSHTMNLANDSMASIMPYLVLTQMLYCPNVSFGPPTMIVSASYGYFIGYNQLGGHLFSTTNYPGLVPWISPQLSTDDPTLAVIADPNHWAVQELWSIVPHSKAGPVLDGRSSFVRAGGGVPAAALGGVGGNVGLLDGSVSWKRIGDMQPHVASHGDIYVGSW